MFESKIVKFWRYSWIFLRFKAIKKVVCKVVEGESSSCKWRNLLSFTSCTQYRTSMSHCSSSTAHSIQIAMFMLRWAWKLILIRNFPESCASCKHSRLTQTKNHVLNRKRKTPSVIIIVERFHFSVVFSLFCMLFENKKEKIMKGMKCVWKAKQS